MIYVKIRNLPFDQLNGKEKAVVKRHYEGQMNDIGSECRNEKCKEGVEQFWEMHREIDTENGTYDGWIDK